MSAADRYPFPLRALTRDWAGETALVVGNGTSVEDIDPTVLSEFQRYGRVLVMNSGMHLYPKADVLICADKHWVASQPTLRPFKGSEIITTQPQAAKHLHDKRLGWMRRHYIENGGADAAMDKPDTLVEGWTSISSAISISVKRGVRRIIIIGCDLHPGPQRKRRAWGDDVDDVGRARTRYAKQVLHLTKQAHLVHARGVHVINCSPQSTLRVYAHGDLEESVKLARLDSPRRV